MSQQDKNSKNGDSQNDAAVGLTQRLERLEATIEDYEKTGRSRRQTSVIVGIALSVLCLGALTSLTAMFLQLDAPALAQIGRLEVEKRLPDGRESLAEFLVAESPRVVREGFLTLADKLPILRQAVVADLTSKLESISEGGRTALVDQTVAAVKASKDSIESQVAGRDDQARIEAIVAAVAKGFTENVDASLDAIYPRYVDQLDSVQALVHGLADADDRELSRKERLQKELFRTLLKIVVAERREGI
jgi:hypothetical protein